MSFSTSDLKKDVQYNITSSKYIKKIFINPFIASLVCVAAIGVLLIFLFQCELESTKYNKIFKYLFYSYIIISVVFVINFNITSHENKIKMNSASGGGYNSVTLDPVKPRELLDENNNSLKF